MGEPSVSLPYLRTTGLTESRKRWAVILLHQLDHLLFGFELGNGKENCNLTRRVSNSDLNLGRDMRLKEIHCLRTEHKVHRCAAGGRFFHPAQPDRRALARPEQAASFVRAGELDTATNLAGNEYFDTHHHPCPHF